jgi:2-oxoglutarate ferredoxin oxidoreductase subunit beta
MPCSRQPNHRQELITLGQNAPQYITYENETKLTWCGGCGDYGIRNALIRSLTLEELTPQDVLLCYDVGCHGNGSDKIDAYTFHGLHGRVLPAAAGAAVANQRLKVIAEAGDGGTFSEGIHHLVHAIRNDYPMVFLLHNNENYGLTTGQPSSTTKRDQVMNAAPDGVFLDPMRPAHFALSVGPSFVARTFSGDVKHMTETIRAALRHDGFAFVEILQVCTTYNRATPQSWYWDRIKYLTDDDHDRSDIWAAMKAAYDIENEINLGVLYHKTKHEPFLSRLKPREDMDSELVDEVKHYDISNLMKKYV